MKLKLQPISRWKVYEFIDNHHRHHRPPQGYKFAIALTKDGEMVAVVTVGRPVSRMLDDGFTAEVTRLCTDDTPHAASKLYAAAWRAAKAMGYTRIVTYILESETGVSLKAAGWVKVHRSPGGSWSRKSRPRKDKHPLDPKVMWEKT